LLRDERISFRPGHSTTLQLARFVERVNRNFDERRLTSAVLLDVAKAFDTVWVKGFLYKLTFLNFPSYPVITISSYLDFRTFQTSFQSATSTCRAMRAGVVQSGLVFSVLFSLYVNDIPTPSRQVELVQYADDTALAATSRSSSLLLYKQFVRPMMDYVCPIWKSAARRHVRKLQVLQSKCLSIASIAPWFASNRQNHEDLGIPFFADHITALTEGFDSNLADAGNPLVRQIGRHLCRPRAD
jgi:hypothetical protein